MLTGRPSRVSRRVDFVFSTTHAVASFEDVGGMLSFAGMKFAAFGRRDGPVIDPQARPVYVRFEDIILFLLLFAMQYE